MDASVPLRMENKVITGGSRRGRDLVGEERGTGSGMGWDRREAQRTKRMNRNMQPQEVEGPSRKCQKCGR